MKRLCTLSLLGFALMVAPVAMAAPDDKLSQVEAQMEAQKKQQEKLEAQTQAASKNIEELRAKLIAAAQNLQQKQNEEETLEDRLDNLTQQISAKSQAAAEERAKLKQIIAAMVEIAGRPPETLFLQDGVTADHIHRSVLLRAILPQMKKQAEAAAHDLLALYDMKTQLSEQKRLVDAAQQNLKKQQRALDQLIAERQNGLQRTEAQKEEIAQKLERLAGEAKDLRQLIQKVTPADAKPPKPFAKGSIALKWPVAGSIARRFGEKDGDGVISQGITFRAPGDATVTAPFSGKVAFAGPFRGYGLIVIIQHANGYHSLLSGFGRIDAEMGQQVSTGEPLGVLPPAKSGGRAEIYFEWRHGDEPLDPAGT